MKKFLGVLCLIGISYLSSASAHVETHPFFISLHSSYQFVHGSRTQGDLQFTDVQGHFLLKNEHLHYQNALSPQVIIGYHCNSHLAFLLSLQHIVSLITMKQLLIDSSGQSTLTTNLSMPYIDMTRVLAQSLFNLGRGAHIGSFKMTPFIDLGVGITFWDLSGMQINSNLSATSSSSGSSLAYEIGLGVNNQLSTHFSLDYGLHYTWYGRYKSHTLAAGPTHDLHAIKQAVSASIFTLSPYIGMRYSL